MATIPTYMSKKGTLVSGSGAIKTGVAASEIPFGALVGRAADGTIQATLTGTVYSYLGVAVNDKRQQKPFDGFYAAGKKVPYVATGLANVWLLGGQTIDSGDFVMVSGTLGAGTEPLGVVVPETSPTTKTLASIGVVVDENDSGSADYDQAISSYSGNVVTFANAATKNYLGLVDGDYVVIDSNEKAEVNMVADADRSSTTVELVKDVLSGHVNNKTMYKLTPITIRLI